VWGSGIRSEHYHDVSAFPVAALKLLLSGLKDIHM
jgi:hypothetical protein